MRRLGYYSKLSGQAPQESDPPKKLLAHTHHQGVQGSKQHLVWSW